jgi:hypothetical protein
MLRTIRGEQEIEGPSHQLADRDFPSNRKPL